VNPTPTARRLITATLAVFAMGSGIVAYLTT
jgi:hypothetical protein